jgi:hypothetical protein
MRYPSSAGVRLSALALAFVTLWACEGVDNTDLFGSPSDADGGTAAGMGGSASAGGSSSTGGAGSGSGTGGAGGSGGIGGSAFTGGNGGTAGTSGGSGGSGGGESGGMGGGGASGAGGSIGGEAGASGGEGGAPEPVGGAGGAGGAGGEDGSGCEHAEVCDGRDNDCNGSTDPLGTCPPGCDGVAGQDKGHGYMVCEVSSLTDLSWAEAQERCQQESPDMHLAWIETPAENQFLRDAADELVENEVWIGASDLDVEGAWYWSPGGIQFWDQSANEGAGAPVDGQEPQWDSGQPNNLSTIEPEGEDCAVLSGDGTWNDYRCNITTVEGFICELED